MFRYLGAFSLLGWAQVCGTDWVARMPHAPAVPSASRTRGWPDTSCRSVASYTIPIVFHVIHSGGADSVSETRIAEQMQRLFEDFRRIPGSLGFTPKGVDMDIDFSLATKDPNGQPTTGIVYWRYDAPPLSWSQPGLCITDEVAMKSATAWPQDKYLNIWVVPAICGFSGDCADCSGIAGYAYYPDVGVPWYGAVVAAQFIGGRLSGRGGRTLVHELGHNLGLAHPFEGGCATANCYASGDEVCDTPPTAQENFSVRRQNTCSTDSPDLPDDPRNFMDYVDDASMSHFTQGQQQRAENFLLLPTSSLWPLYEPTNLIQTGTGPYGRVKVDFWAEAQRVLVGTPVRFHAVASGAPSQFWWDFGGGVADDSLSLCPIVTFPAPGDYSVRLIAQNAGGARDTLSRAAYITVEDSIWALPLLQGWESLPFPPAGFSVENLDRGQGGSRTWERWGSASTAYGAYGQSYYTARIPFFAYSRYGERDYLLTPALDFSVDSAYGIQLRFAVSYTCLDWGGGGSFPTLYTDTLRVWASPDGGGRWELVYERGGPDLSTDPGGCRQIRSSLAGATHLPTPSSWRTDTVDLTSYRGLRGVRLRFEGVCGWGNTLYLDDLVVDTVRVARPSTGISHWPFSVSASAEGLRLQLDHPQALSFTAYTLLGQQVWQDTQALSAGRHSLPLPVLSAGMYLLEVRSTEGPYRLWQRVFFFP